MLTVHRDGSRIVLIPEDLQQVHGRFRVLLVPGQRCRGRIVGAEVLLSFSGGTLLQKIRPGERDGRRREPPLESGRHCRYRPDHTPENQVETQVGAGIGVCEQIKN